MSIRAKRVKLEECSSDKDYWLVFFQDNFSHGEKLKREELHELYLDLRDFFEAGGND